MTYKELLHTIETHVTACFKRDMPEHLYYHNLWHTQQVVSHCTEIAAHYSLAEEEEFKLIAAAWFHDAGQLYKPGLLHEEKSAQLMETFLDEYCSNKVIEAIHQLILATRYPPAPVSLLEKIICDADTYHFGTPVFLQTDLLVKKELEAFIGHPVSQWKEKSIQLLQQHRFHTSYCQEKLKAGKQANIDHLKSHL